MSRRLLYNCARVLIEAGQRYVFDDGPRRLTNTQSGQVIENVELNGFGHGSENSHP